MLRGPGDVAPTEGWRRQLLVSPVACAQVQIPDPQHTLQVAPGPDLDPGLRLCFQILQLDGDRVLSSNGVAWNGRRTRMSAARVACAREAPSR